MKPKYFAADSYEGAVERACAYFSCTQKELFLEVVTKGGNNTEWEILACKGSPGNLANMNGFYVLSYEETGVYLELYAHRDNGIPIDRNDMTSYILRKGLQGMSAKDTLALATKGKGRVRIAPPQTENILGEDLTVEISEDEMEASVKLRAPDEGGEALSLSAALQKLRHAGVTRGVDENAVSQALSDKQYGAKYVVARGTPPQNGQDGKLTFHFSTAERTGRPKILEDGRVDYKTLDLIEPVTEGQLLVSRSLATPGTAGVTVTGKDCPVKPGRDVLLPRSKNTVINEDSTAVYAATGGMVEYVSNVITVSNIYKIDGDCDMSVGNIDFDGSVYISGNVISGQRIKASGSIMIDGVVEASEITAGGNIEIKRGIQGSGSGRIVAGGSVTTQYIERCTVIAEDSIIIDAAIQSDLEAGRSLIAQGKRGCIIGGLARIGGEVKANSIGSNAHTLTEIEVGMIPQKRARAVFLEKELENLNEEMDKLEKIDQYLEKTKGKLVGENWDRIAQSAAESRKRNVQLLNDYSDELSILKREAEEASNGHIHVFGTTFPGVKIMISSGMLRVNNNIEHATFKLADGEIFFIPCEVKRQI